MCGHRVELAVEEELKGKMKIVISFFVAISMPFTFLPLQRCHATPVVSGHWEVAH